MSTKTRKSPTERIDSANNLFQQATELSVQREQFENTDLARTNKKLYELLASTFRLYVTAEEQSCMTETTAQMRNALIAKGFKVQVNTPALTLFVRYVFNSDRKRSYFYATALQAAKVNKVTPDRLARFIEEKGGVEECRKRVAASAETLQKRATLDAAATAVRKELSTMTGVRNVILSDKTVPNHDASGFAVLIARHQGNGSYEILRVIPKMSTAIERFCVKELAKAYVEVKAANTALVKKSQLDDAINNAAANASLAAEAA